ncbi:MAG: cyclodeaminase/cyclohydrolase family protein [Oscillospiraceae bacterium]|nr:cyclodeaminase/cyclohydrolase family protein [Oscillospiraceae bacterium]
MSEHKIRIELYRDKSIDELSKILSNPDEKPDTGTAAAAVAAIGAAFLCRSAALASRVPAERSDSEKDRLDWLVRNSEILRSYMVKLADEDVRCRGPLRKALKEGDERTIEAARQTAVSICAEVIHMAGAGLDIAMELGSYADAEIAALLRESAVLILAAAECCVPHILYMAGYSSDDTYIYVTRRENELNLTELRNKHSQLLEILSGR